MKYAVVILACVAVVCAQYNLGKYNPVTTPRPLKYKPFSTPPPFQFPQYGRYSTRAPLAPVVTPAAPVYASPVPKLVSESRNAETVEYNNEIYPDGSFNYNFQTQNGISAQAQGTPRDFGGNPPVVPVVMKGSYAYTSPEGVPVIITYTADENGYQPEGNLLPTPPPVPAQIARALSYIANVQKK